MFDFTNSIKNGIAAAETAQENIKEIKAVFLELASQVENYSSGTLTAKLETAPDVWGQRNGFTAGILGAAIMGAGLGTNASGIKDKTSLVLLKKGNSPEKVSLATVDISKLGYPVKFTYADQVSNASDKESLVMLLSTILEHPDSGKAISRMMQPRDPGSESDDHP